MKIARGLPGNSPVPARSKNKTAFPEISSRNLSLLHFTGIPIAISSISERPNPTDPDGL